MVAWSAPRINGARWRPNTLLCDALDPQQHPGTTGIPWACTLPFPSFVKELAGMSPRVCARRSQRPVCPMTVTPLNHLFDLQPITWGGQLTRSGRRKSHPITNGLCGIMMEGMKSRICTVLACARSGTGLHACLLFQISLKSCAVTLTPDNRDPSCWFLERGVYAQCRDGADPKVCASKLSPPPPAQRPPAGSTVQHCWSLRITC